MAKVGNFGHHVRKCSLLRDVKEIFQISCKEFSEPHRGNKDARVFVYLAACVSECLREYSIEEKIMILTADNASNNKNTLVEELWNVIPPLEVWSIVRMMKPAHNSDVDLSIAEDNLEVDSIKLDIECQFDLVEQGLNGDIDGIGDEQPPVDPDNEDEIAGDVAASDALAVDIAIPEADRSIRLYALTSKEANLGQMSIETSGKGPLAQAALGDFNFRRETFGLWVASGVSGCLSQ
ncbi:hypothetical protein GALMADRAFT_1346293 [Galerina marginata CBS 339.88]|uniref:Uncharacterized protein n=1 Tax=Galerina marginata (strain CBS 339.88) TaxID=685588 RepID=A0A067SMC6_GALM3|nr:hypothetical protein GALMADRAFT_1346293 [Galerina marginata CBS 339.88]